MALVGMDCWGAGNAFTSSRSFGDDRYNVWVIMIMASWRHIGYISAVVLSWPKGGWTRLCVRRQPLTVLLSGTFRKVVFPAMKPVNVIVLVITIIESLRPSLTWCTSSMVVEGAC